MIAPWPSTLRVNGGFSPREAPARPKLRAGVAFDENFMYNVAYQVYPDPP